MLENIHYIIQVVCHNSMILVKNPDPTASESGSGSKKLAELQAVLNSYEIIPINIMYEKNDLKAKKGPEEEMNLDPYPILRLKCSSCKSIRRGSDQYKYADQNPDPLHCLNCRLTWSVSILHSSNNITMDPTNIKYSDPEPTKCVFEALVEVQADLVSFQVSFYPIISHWILPI